MCSPDVHSLVFPERTFYLCAKTGVEADEWIKIIRWKLVSLLGLRVGTQCWKEVGILPITQTAGGNINDNYFK